MKRILLVICVMVCSIYSLKAESTEKIKAVIVTGQNNHNWPVSSTVLEKILENSGIFNCDVAISPKNGEDFSSFNVDFSAYDVVVLDYNGDKWNEKMNSDFESYVKSGGGVVVYHAADNAFPDWPFYNQVIALGGWCDRTEDNGVQCSWSDGKIVKRKASAPFGSHGKAHQYQLTARSKHPIIKGLPTKWLHNTDELYDRMTGPGNIKSLLYSAYSETEGGGSGYEEPLIFTVDFGKTRIFHTMIGHAGATVEDNPAMQCTGFQVTLLRGAEWAATGKVKQRVPSDFPTADKISLRKEYK